MTKKKKERVDGICGLCNALERYRNDPTKGQSPEQDVDVGLIVGFLLGHLGALICPAHHAAVTRIAQAINPSSVPEGS